MTYKNIKQKLTKKEISIEEALENLSEIGYCPNLLNDDNGHWAVVFDGFQSMPIGDAPDDVALTCFVEAKDWKDSIYDALISALQ